MQEKLDTYRSSVWQNGWFKEIKRTKNATFPLKLVFNENKSKLLFAEVDGDFADVLLSFLSFPLGTIARIFDGDGAPPLGSSLGTLYKGVADLDGAHFWKKGAKSILVNPPSSCEDECRRVKLELSSCRRPLEHFYCANSCYGGETFRSSSVYYDKFVRCKECGDRSMKRAVVRRESGGGGFVMNAARFVVTDDLQIWGVGTEVLQVLSALGITDLDKTKTVNITFGFPQVMDLLKACLISFTPLSDVIFDQKKSRLQRSISSDHHQTADSSKKMILKLVLQKSTKRFLYAEAGDDFVEFLFSFLLIPVAQVENLLEGDSPFKGITSLYRSAAHHINDHCFKTPQAKHKLIKPEIPHGCLPHAHILPLLQQDLPHYYPIIADFSSKKFPQGQGKYLKPQTRFMVADDLTVTPLTLASMFAFFKGVKVHVSDLELLERHIGLKQGLDILRASLTSTSALTDALDLTDHTSHKQVKQEH